MVNTNNQYIYGYLASALNGEYHPTQEQNNGSGDAHNPSSSDGSSFGYDSNVLLAVMTEPEHEKIRTQ